MKVFLKFGYNLLGKSKIQSKKNGKMEIGIVICMYMIIYWIKWSVGHAARWFEEKRAVKTKIYNKKNFKIISKNLSFSTPILFS